jgi:hypothetical protein
MDAFFQRCNTLRCYSSNAANLRDLVSDFFGRLINEDSVGLNRYGYTLEVTSFRYVRFKFFCV